MPKHRPTARQRPTASSARLGDHGHQFIVAVFYCLGALHGERRDRSILFWKSLPVSDLTTVLSKAAMPLVVLPVVTCAIILATSSSCCSGARSSASANGHRPERPVGTLRPRHDVARAALRPVWTRSGAPRLRLADAGLGLGAADAVPVGRAAAARRAGLFERMPSTPPTSDAPGPDRLFGGFRRRSASRQRQGRHPQPERCRPGQGVQPRPTSGCGLDPRPPPSWRCRLAPAKTRTDLT